MKNLFALVVLSLIGLFFNFNNDKSDITADESFGFLPNSAHADALPPPPDPDGG